jgi:hypothetical protein
MLNIKVKGVDAFAFSALVKQSSQLTQLGSAGTRCNSTNCTTLYAEVVPSRISSDWPSDLSGMIKVQGDG